MRGAPVRLGLRRVRSGHFRIVYQKSSYIEQLAHAFWLFDTSISILIQVLII